jgi:hypothetical protein
MRQFVGIDWAYRRAAWCALSEGGAISQEGAVPADEDGLGKLVLVLGTEVKACVEMMSGAIWVRDRLEAAGWRVQVAHARKVRDVAPLACKTDKVDARVLAELCRRDLVPELWIPSLDDRALRERLRRRMHLVRMRASAMNRIFGLLTQFGLRLSLERLRAHDAMQLLESRGMPAVWRRSIAEALAVIDWLDGRLAPLEPRAGSARPRRRARGAAGNHPRDRAAARFDHRRRGRRHRPLRIGAQARRLRRTGPEGQAVRAELAYRARYRRPAPRRCAGRRRGRPAGLARDQPVA